MVAGSGFDPEQTIPCSHVVTTAGMPIGMQRQQEADLDQTLAQCSMYMHATVSACSARVRRTLKRWGLSMGHTTSSCTRRLAWSWPAMSSHCTRPPASTISLQTSSSMAGSSFCSASGSSPSGPVAHIIHHCTPHPTDRVSSRFHSHSAAAEPGLALYA